MENPDVDAQWGLGCSLCASYSSSSSASSSPWVTFKKGCGAGVLQVKDVADHEKSDMHLTSLRRSRPTSEAEEPADALGLDVDVPTAALIRLSVEVASTPLGAQGLEFERKAKLAARADAANFVPCFNNRMYHGRIITALATVLLLALTINFSVSCLFCLAYWHDMSRLWIGVRFDEDRELLKKKQVARIGWAEDRSFCNQTEPETD